MTLQVPVCISDFRVHLKLCRMGEYATVAPYMHLHQLMEEEKKCDDSAKLLMFPLLNIRKEYNIEIITHREAPPLKIVNKFSQVLEHCCHECYTEIDEFISERN